LDGTRRFLKVFKVARTRWFFESLLLHTRDCWFFKSEFVQNTHRLGGITRIKYPDHTGASLPKPDIPNQNWYEVYELPTFNCGSGLCTTFRNYYYMGRRHHIDIGNKLVPHAAFEPRAIF
jgi:hypothetical protein